MSLKIYGAYKMRSMSMHRFQQWCDSLRAQATEVAQRGFAAYLAQALCQKLDAHALGHEQLESADLWAVKTALITEAISDTAPLESNWELSLRAISDSRFVYLMSDYRYSHYTSLLQSLEGLRSFDYQNASDSVPDGVTAVEWEHRSRVWKRLLSKTTLSECGVQVDVIAKHHYCFPSAALVRRMLPSLKARSTLVTVEHEIEIMANSILPLYPNKPALLYREAKRHVFSKENQAILEAKIIENQQQLVDISAQLS